MTQFLSIAMCAAALHGPACGVAGAEQQAVMNAIAPPGAGVS